MYRCRNYGPSESDLEWEQDSEDEDDWLKEDDDDLDEDDEDNGEQVDEGCDFSNDNHNNNDDDPQNIPPNQSNSTQQDADGDETMSDCDVTLGQSGIGIPSEVLGEIIKVDVERTRGSGGLRVG